LKDISETIYFPKYIEMETIRACNAKCLMCTIHDWEGKNNKMNDKLFFKIAEEFERYKNWINQICIRQNWRQVIQRLPRKT